MNILIFLVKCLHKQNARTKLSILISRILLPLAALIFVDDTDLCAFNSGSETTAELVQKAQIMLDAWYQVLKFVGGHLKLTKCY